MPNKPKTPDRETWEINTGLFPASNVRCVFSGGDRNYIWLLRSSDPQAVETRERLERWFEAYPADIDGKWELYRRFSNDDELQHVGACWELTCCMFLQKQGFDVTVHPHATQGKSTHPDFRACRGKQVVLDLECRLLEGPMVDVAESKRISNFMATLCNRVTSSRFWVHVQLERRANKHPSGRKIADQIQFALDRAKEEPPDDVELKSNGWHFNVQFYPKNGAVVANNYAIPGSGWSDSCSAAEFTSAIKDKLNEKKAGRYGVENTPYIIALNSRSPISDDHVERALYGDLALIQESNKYRSKKNGFFSIENSRVSAVLWTYDSVPTNCEAKQPTLWHNPNAVNPLDPTEWSCQQVVYCTETASIRRC